MAFQGLRRGIAKLTEQDPHIHLLIQEEKDVMMSLDKFTKEKNEASSYLAKWGEHEHADLMDITQHLHGIDLELNNSLEKFAGNHMNDIRMLHTIPGWDERNQKT